MRRRNGRDRGGGVPVPRVDLELRHRPAAGDEPLDLATLLSRSGDSSGGVAWWDLGSCGDAEARLADEVKEMGLWESRGRDPIRAFVPATAPRPLAAEAVLFLGLWSSRLSGYKKISTHAHSIFLVKEQIIPTFTTTSDCSQILQERDIVQHPQSE